MNYPGITIRQSKYSVKDSIDRLQLYLQGHGITIYARIDQQAEVLKTGQQLLPIEFIMFGNPISGGPIMAQNPLVALDLPLKVIAWQDDQKNTWLAYNDATYIEERYSLPHQPMSPLSLDKLIDTLSTI